MRILTILFLVLFMCGTVYSAEKQIIKPCTESHKKIEVPQEIKELRKKHIQEMKVLMEKYPEYAATKKRSYVKLRKSANTRILKRFDFLCDECKSKFKHKLDQKKSEKKNK